MTSQVFTTLRKMLPILMGVCLFGLGIYALRHLLISVDPVLVKAQIKAASSLNLALAIAATAVAYAALVGYDALALRFIGKKLPAPVVALGGFLGYAFGNNIGVSVISGGAVRYRIYSAYGLDAFEVATVSGYIAAAIGTGLTLIGLAALALHPSVIPQISTFSPMTIRFAALGILLAVSGVILFVSARGLRLRLWRFTLQLPEPRSLAAQFAMTLLDVVAAAFALWILMPVGTPDLASFIAIYAIAMMVGVLSHVPGGIGVFEAVIIGTLPSSVAVSDAAAALVLFRIIYYLLPFALGFIVVALNEARLASGLVKRMFGGGPATTRPIVGALHALAPRLAALVSFGFGVYLLMVSLVPSLRSSAIQEGEFVARLVIEGGTLLLAAIGLGLIVLSQGLARRVKAAFYLTLAVLGLGTIAAVANGFSIEAVAILVAGIVLLLPFAGGFTREASLSEGLLSLIWSAMALGLALAVFSVLMFLLRASN